MSNVKERIFGALTVMSEEEALYVWEKILERFNGNAWENIKEETPDEIDLQMLKEIKNDADCKEFITSMDLKKELGLNV